METNQEGLCSLFEYVPVGKKASLYVIVNNNLDGYNLSDISEQVSQAVKELMDRELVHNVCVTTEHVQLQQQILAAQARLRVFPASSFDVARLSFC
jgi:hypothetical protein